MKKYVLPITFLLAMLIFLNGCTVTTVGTNPMEEKETFATQENDGEELQTEEISTAPHKYSVQEYKQEITSPDGEILATVEYSYPVFESNDGDNAEYVAQINERLRTDALDLVKSAELDYENTLYAYEYRNENGGLPFIPYVYRYGYDIHTDKDGILSLTEVRYYYTGGAHGGTVQESHTFDTAGGKELSLSDLLYGTQEEITEAFTNEFMKIADAFFGDPSQIVPIEFPSAQFYVDEKGVTAYFQQYQVGPYASGFVSATVSDKEMLKYSFSN